MGQTDTQSRDGNGAGLFGYSFRPVPNGMGFNFNKGVLDKFENFFKNPGQVWVLPHPAPPRLYIKLIFKFNLIKNLKFILFYFTIFNI